MKEEIIKFFENDRSFNGAIALYSKYGRNALFLRSVNIKGDTPKNKESLLYELLKLTGLSGKDFQRLINAPVGISPDAMEKLATIAAKLKAENLTANQKTPNSAPVDVEVKALLDKAPEEFVKSVKLRQEFPFLNENTCPNELKILVADMLTAYNNYVEAHPKLALAENAEEVSALAETVVENYLENRSIWEELNHYKEKGEILGEHPTLQELAFREEIKGKTTPELIKLKDSLYNKITRTKKQITEENKPHLVEERTARVVAFEGQFAIVKKILGIEG